MVETITYSKVYANDIQFGTGTREVELTGGEVVELEEFNITHLLPGSSNQVLYASLDGSVDAEFYYDPTNQVLYAKNIAGDESASADLSIDATTHATSGNILLNASGGNVGIGESSPATQLHISDSAYTAVTVDATGADAAYLLALAGTDQWYVGMDQSDSSKLKVGTGGTVGTNMVMTVTSSAVGVGTAAPDATLHVLTGSTTSTTVSTDADQIIAEANADGGISIITPNSNAGRLRFSRPSDPTAGYLEYDHSADTLMIGVGGADRMTFTGNSVLIGTSTANSFSTQGLTIDQDANDDHAISLQSSDVAHGVTDVATTDTYCYATKFNGANGGLLWVGLSESLTGIGLSGVATTETNTKSDATNGTINITSFLKSGTGTGALAADSNICVFKNSTTSVLIIEGNGDIHTSGAGTLATYDDHDDVKLLKAVKSVMSTNYRDTLGDWINEHTAILERSGVITRDKTSGRYFVSQRGWRGLLVDAIGQLARRIEAIEAGAVG